MIDYIDPTRDVMAAFRDMPLDRPIAMINLIRYRPVAAYPSDPAGPLTEEISGEQAYATYAAAAAAPFARAGGRRIWMATPELTLIGPKGETWDLAFIAQYPSGAAFLTMLADPQYQQAVAHRQAAVADSRLIRCAVQDSPE